MKVLVYFKDNQNKVDLSMMLFNCYYLYTAFHQFYEDVSEETKIVERVWEVPIMILAVAKFLQFLQSNESFGHLITLLIECLKGLSYFMAFFLIFNIFFICFYSSSKAEFDDKDYEHLGPL
jgi:hypothetical protein